MCIPAPNDLSHHNYSRTWDGRVSEHDSVISRSWSQADIRHLADQFLENFPVAFLQVPSASQQGSELSVLTFVRWPLTEHSLHATLGRRGSVQSYPRRFQMRMMPSAPQRAQQKPTERNRRMVRLTLAWCPGASQLKHSSFGQPLPSCPGLAHKKQILSALGSMHSRALWPLPPQLKHFLELSGAM